MKFSIEKNTNGSKCISFETGSGYAQAGVDVIALVYKDIIERKKAAKRREHYKQIFVVASIVLATAFVAWQLNKR